MEGRKGKEGKKEGKKEGIKGKRREGKERERRKETKGRKEGKKDLLVGTVFTVFVGDSLGEKDTKRRKRNDDIRR